VPPPIPTIPGGILSGLQPRQNLAQISEGSSLGIRAKNIGFAGRIKIPAFIQVAVSAIASINKGM